MLVYGRDYRRTWADCHFQRMRSGGEQGARRRQNGQLVTSDCSIAAACGRVRAVSASARLCFTHIFLALGGGKVHRTVIMELTITHIFLAPSKGHVRRTVPTLSAQSQRPRTVRRTWVDRDDSRGQCATHWSQTYLFRLILCDRRHARSHSPHLWR